MFELACPWVLLALPLPAAVWYVLPRAKVSLPSAMKVPFYHAIVEWIDVKKKGLAKVKHGGLVSLNRSKEKATTLC